MSASPPHLREQAGFSQWWLHALLMDPAGGESATLAPGLLQRVREMAALRERGWSLDEIALRYGVSRERVRQILRAHGGPGCAERRRGTSPPRRARFPAAICA